MAIDKFGEGLDASNGRQNSGDDELKRMSDVLKLLEMKKSDVSQNSSETQSTCSEQPDENLAPDGGWGWLVCLGSFVINFILDGTMFSFGVMLMSLLEYFDESKAKTSWIGSVLLGLSMILGPFVGWLLDRFSIRQVTLCGALVAACGFIASTFAPNVEVLILTYGVIGGIGFCMMFIPSIIVVGLYFCRKRALVTGIAMSGSGVGTFVYAYLCEALLSEFNWRGTVLIMAGILLNCVVCAALFRPLSNKRAKKQCRTAEGGKIYDCVQCFDSNESSNTTLDTKGRYLYTGMENLRNGSTLFNSTSVLDKRTQACNSYIQDISNRESKMSSKRMYSSTGVLNRPDNKGQPCTLKAVNPLTRTDIYYSGSIRNIPKSFSSSESLHSDQTEELFEYEIEVKEVKDTSSCGCLQKLGGTVDLSLMKNSKFTLLLLCMMLWTGGRGVDVIRWINGSSCT